MNVNGSRLGPAPRESYLVHPRSDKQPRNAHHLLRGQQTRGIGEVYAVLGHAVQAPQVAALGEGDAKIVVMSAERVGEREIRPRPRGRRRGRGRGRFLLLSFQLVVGSR